MKLHLAILIAKIACAGAIAWIGYSIMSAAMTLVGAALR